MDIYDRIDNVLKQKKISRRKLAELAGINVNTMSSLFARRPSNFPRQYLNQIAEVLDITPAALEGYGIFQLVSATPADSSASHTIRAFEFSGVDTKPKENESSPLSETLRQLERMDKKTLEFVIQYANTLLANMD